jgi:hypothetical protein
MTKKQMIQSMQKQEAAFFLQAKQSEFDNGRDDAMTIHAFNKWLGISHMLHHLGIPEDLTLPEAQAAADLIVQIDRQKD